MNRKFRSMVGRFAAEIVVIVVGILLALAVDSWAQDRQDREDEAVYLEALREEVQTTLDGAESVMDRESDIVRRLRLLQDGLDRRPTARPDSLETWLELGALYPSALYRPQSPTADALVETGDIALVQDRAVRRLIITHRERVRQVAAIFQVLDEASMDAIASLNRRITRRAVDRGDVDWQGIANDRVIRGNLQTLSTWANTRRNYAEFLLESSTRPLNDALDEESGG